MKKIISDYCGLWQVRKIVTRKNVEKRGKNQLKLKDCLQILPKLFERDADKESSEEKQN